jgi:hypothetical protein
LRSIVTKFHTPTTIGDGLVEVWHSDPQYGDPKEGIFFLDAEATPQQVDKVRREKHHIWVDRMEQGGYHATTQVQYLGPYTFRDPKRHDLSPEKSYLLEYILTAYFKRDRPETITTDEADRRRQLAAKYGLPARDPVRWDKGEPTPGITPTQASEHTSYVDPNNRDEQGLLPEQREAMNDDGI